MKNILIYFLIFLPLNIMAQNRLGISYGNHLSSFQFPTGHGSVSGVSKYINSYPQPGRGIQLGLMHYQSLRTSDYSNSGIIFQGTYNFNQTNKFKSRVIQGFGDTKNQRFSTHSISVDAGYYRLRSWGASGFESNFVLGGEYFATNKLTIYDQDDNPHGVRFGYNKKDGLIRYAGYIQIYAGILKNRNNYAFSFGPYVKAPLSASFFRQEDIDYIYPWFLGGIKLCVHRNYQRRLINAQF